MKRDITIRLEWKTAKKLEEAIAKGVFNKLTLAQVQTAYAVDKLLFCEHSWWCAVASHQAIRRTAEGRIEGRSNAYQNFQVQTRT